MAITRKHYSEVAEIIKGQVESAQYLPDSGQAVLTTASQIARELATVYKSDNSAFRYDTFFAACDLDPFGYAK